MTDYVTGRRFDTGEQVCVFWKDGVIADIKPAKTVTADDIWIAPPLFDLQINGFAGVDFQKDFVAATDLLRAANELFKHGCLKFFLTLITDDWERIVSKLRRLKQIRDENDLLKKAIAGWHIEGPFLSDKPGFYGTHNPAKMINPSPSHIRELRNILENDKIIITIAPERENALESIKVATELGITVFLGHTDASSEIIKLAMENGAKGFTHIGNGCPLTLERKDNIIWRVLDIDELPVTIIPDKIHVSPMLFRIIHKVKTPDKICYVSDAISAAGSPPGRYSLGEIEVESGEDGVIWNKSKTGYAGSSLCPFDGVLRAMEMLGEKWQNVWRRYSILPAGMVGIDCELRAGNAADFVIIRQNGQGRPTIDKVYFSGKQIYP